MEDINAAQTKGAETEKITLPFMGFGPSIMLKAMLSKSNRNIRVCTDMTKDNGIVVDKDKICQT